jgi:hypothetical protein
MLGLVDLVLRQTSAVCDADRAAIDTVREAAAIGMNSSFPTPTPALAAARSGKYKLAAQRAAKAAQLAGRAFRKHFVLKVVPMLNPDGVARGLHRCNARGEDMNRSYLAPDAARHPVVSAVRNALTKWVSQGEQVALFADLHAHTKKRGVFVFGNELQSAESQVENVLFPKLVALHTQHFDFRASVFGRMDVAGRRDHIWFVRKNFGCSLYMTEFSVRILNIISIFIIFQESAKPYWCRQLCWEWASSAFSRHGINSLLHAHGELQRGCSCERARPRSGVRVVCKARPPKTVGNSDTHSSRRIRR